MLLTAAQSLTKRFSHRLPAIILYVNSTTSLVIGLATQSIGFIILARYFGKAQFGQLTAITAGTGLAAAWVQLGCSEAMRRRVPRDPTDYNAVLGHCVTLIFGWGSVVTVVFSAIASAFVHIVPDMASNFLVLLMFIVCNLILFPWISLTEQIFLAHDNFRGGNLVNAGFGAIRAAAALVACLVFGVRNLQDWAYWNLAAYICGALACAVGISRYGAPRIGILREELPIGATFGISGFLAALRSNTDVLVLTAVASLDTVGAYGLTKRILSIAVVTGASLDRLVYTKLAVSGQDGASATLKLASRYVVYAIILTGMTSLALFFIGAPALTLVFGDHFKESVGILRILCWVLILYGVQNIAFDALNAANLHRFQVLLSSGAVLVGSAAVLAFTTSWGLKGTYAGVYLSETIAAAALWGGLLFLGGRAKIPGKFAR